LKGAEMSILTNTYACDFTSFTSKPVFSVSGDAKILSFASEIYGFGQTLLKDIDLKSDKDAIKTEKSVKTEKKW
jgi:hypothetical protein